MSEQHYDFYGAIRTLLSRTSAEGTGDVPDRLRAAHHEALRYRRQLDALRAELERLLAETSAPTAPPGRGGPAPSKRLACHHADRADATRLVEGDLPPWMVDCSEPH
ncbi:MAG TPA: hypothetical protein VFZ66_04015 [Herpetosiphonaceae bacterium]